MAQVTAGRVLHLTETRFTSAGACWAAVSNVPSDVDISGIDCGEGGGSGSSGGDRTFLPPRTPQCGAVLLRSSLHGATDMAHASGEPERALCTCLALRAGGCPAQSAAQPAAQALGQAMLSAVTPGADINATAQVRTLLWLNSSCQRLRAGCGTLALQRQNWLRSLGTLHLLGESCCCGSGSAPYAALKGALCAALLRRRPLAPRPLCCWPSLWRLEVRNFYFACLRYSCAGARPALALVHTSPLAKTCSEAPQLRTVLCVPTSRFRLPTAAAADCVSQAVPFWAQLAGLVRTDSAQYCTAGAAGDDLAAAVAAAPTTMVAAGGCRQLREHGQEAHALLCIAEQQQQQQHLQQVVERFLTSCSSGRPAGDALAAPPAVPCPAVTPMITQLAAAGPAGWQQGITIASQVGGRPQCCMLRFWAESRHRRPLTATPVLHAGYSAGGHQGLPIPGQPL